MDLSNILEINVKQSTAIKCCCNIQLFSSVPFEKFCFFFPIWYFYLLFFCGVLKYFISTLST